MKKTLLLSIALVLALSLFAQDRTREIFLEYWQNSTPETMQAALDHLNEVIKGDGDDVSMANYYLYLLHSKEENEAEAAVYMNYLIANVADLMPGMQFGVGNILLANGRYTEAIAIYEGLNEEMPEWSCPFRHKGEAFHKMKDYPNAEQALLKAIETRETHYDAYLMLAEVYFEQQKNKPALEMMEKAFEVLGADDEDPDEVYTDEEVQFMWLDILKANDDERAAAVEAQLRSKFPEKF